jgi:type IV fimbrial biogenesis protein FimT
MPSCVTSYNHQLQSPTDNFHRTADNPGMPIHAHGSGIQRTGGFTALELLVTVSIAAILLLTGVPALTQFTQKQQLKAAVGALHQDLLLARSEAVNRRLAVVACPGDPAGGCTGTLDWSNGWIAFTDDNGDRLRQAGEVLLRHGQRNGAVMIRGSSGRTQLRFYPDGSAPGSNGTISFCGRAGPAQARKLVISNVGRIRRDFAPELGPSRCPTS